MTCFFSLSLDNERELVLPVSSEPGGNWDMGKFPSAALSVTSLMCGHILITYLRIIVNCPTQKAGGWVLDVMSVGTGGKIQIKVACPGTMLGSSAASQLKEMPRSNQGRGKSAEEDDQVHNAPSLWTHSRTFCKRSSGQQMGQGRKMPIRSPNNFYLCLLDLQHGLRLHL